MITLAQRQKRMERQKLLAMVHRCNRLANRTSDEICRLISQRSQALDTLDNSCTLNDLFLLNKRANVLFRRIYARYEAVLNE